MSNTLNPVDIKRACNLSHAVTRAAERYGVNLTRAEMELIGEAIEAGGNCVRPLRPDGDHDARTWYAVKLAGQWFPVVYDHATRSVVTWLPEHTLDPYRAEIEPAPKPALPPIAEEPKRPSHPAKVARLVSRIVAVDPMPNWPDEPRGLRDAYDRRRTLQAWIDAQMAAVNANRWNPETERRFPSLEVWKAWKAHRRLEIEAARKQCAELRRFMEETLKSDGVAIEDEADPTALLRASLEAIEALRGVIGCKSTKGVGRLAWVIRLHLESLADDDTTTGTGAKGGQD